MAPAVSVGFTGGVRAMWSGYKHGSPEEAIRRKRWIAAGALMALVAGIWTAALQGALP